MSLIGYADVQNFTGFTFASAEQTELDLLAGAVEAQFNKATGRVFYSNATTNHIQYFSLQGSKNTFYLKSAPSTSLVSVELFDENSEAYAAFTGKKYLVDGLKVVIDEYLVNRVPNYVKITYKGAIVPADVKQMLVEWTLLIFNSRHDAGQFKKSASASDVKRDYLIVENLPANLQNIIDLYRIPNV